MKLKFHSSMALSSSPAIIIMVASSVTACTFLVIQLIAKETHAANLEISRSIVEEHSSLPVLTTHL